MPETPTQPTHSRERLPLSSRAGARLMILIPALTTVIALAMGVAYYVLFRDSLAIDETNMTTLRLLIVGSALIAGLLGIVLARTIVLPLRRLEARLHGLAAKGSLDDLGDIDASVPEIGALGRRFDQVLGSLNNYVSERNHYILECFTGGLILLDEAGVVSTMNDRATELFGVEPQALAGEDFAVWLRSSDPMSPLAEVIRVAREDGVYADSREIEVAAGSRDRFPIIVTVSPVSEGESETSGLAINFRDLRDYRRFMQQMDRADRLAAIGTFATGIAHEIRNPLGSVKGLAQLLSEDVDEDSAARGYADVIVREANRLDRVVRSLLDYAHPVETPPEPVDIGHLLSEALILARENGEQERLETISIEENYADTPMAPGQPERLLQAFLNVVRNAIEATPADGMIRLSTELVRTEAGTPAVEARVANTGTRIEADQQARIFEPFYSTKEGGTGLGLPIALQVIKMNGGTLEVTSDAKQTVFAVRLPTKR